MADNILEELLTVTAESEPVEEEVTIKLIVTANYVPVELTVMADHILEEVLTVTAESEPVEEEALIIKLMVTADMYLKRRYM